MLDLLLALLLVAGPAACAALGLHHTLIGAMLAAALLTWPGYMLSICLWPRAEALSLGQRLALAPALSLLVCGVITTVCWFALPDLTFGTAYWGLIIVTAAIALGAALIRRWGDSAQSTRPAAVAMVGLFVGTTSVFAMAAVGPTISTAAPTTALYLDPQAQVAYDPAGANLLVPIVIISPPGAETLELHAEYLGQTIVEQQVVLVSGEHEQHIALAVPARSLTRNDAALLTISLHETGAPSALRMLRLRLAHR